jgi:hypothetical protein
MKEIRFLALETILVLGFAMGAQAQSETTGENGNASNYQIGQSGQQGEGAVGDASNYQIGQPVQQTAGKPDEQATPAPKDPAPLGNVTLNPDWSLPPSL